MILESYSFVFVCHVLDFTQLFLHTIAAGKRRPVIRHVRQRLMLRVTAFSAPLADPIDIAGFTTPVVICGVIFFLIVD